MSETGKRLAVLLENPDEWEVFEYVVKHKSGEEFWIANGPFFFGREEHNPLGIIERFLLWRKLKKMLDKRCAKRLSRERV